MTNKQFKVEFIVKNENDLHKVLNLIKGNVDMDVDYDTIEIKELR